MPIDAYGNALPYDDEEGYDAPLSSLPPLPEEEQSLPSFYDDPALPGDGQVVTGYDEGGNPSFQDYDVAPPPVQDVPVGYAPYEDETGFTEPLPENQLPPAAPGSPTLWDVGAGQATLGLQSDTRALQNAQAAAGTQGPLIRTPDPLHMPVRVAGGIARAANDQTVSATLQGQDIEAQAAQELATFASVESAKADIVAEQMAQSAARRARELQEQVDKSQQIRKSIDEAAKKLADGPEEDEGAFWASRTGFQKIALVLSAAMKGWLQGQGMNVDPMADIRDGIDRNIQAQRSNRARLSERLTARERQAQASALMLDEMTQAYGSQEIAESAMRLAMLQASQAKLHRMAASVSAELIPVEARKFNAALAKEIGEETLKLQAREIAHPKEHVRRAAPKTVPYVGKDGVTYQVSPAFAAKATAGEMDEGREQRKAGAATLGRAAEQTADHELQREFKGLEAMQKATETAKGSPAEKRLIQMQKREYYQATHLLREENNQWSKFLSQYKDGIPGLWSYNMGKGWTTLTDEQQEAYDLAHRAVMIRLRKESGAAIGENEKVEDAESALALHSEEAHKILTSLDEDDVLREAQTRLEENNRRLEYATRMVDPEVLEEFHAAEHPGTSPLGIPSGDPDDGFEPEVEEAIE